MRAFAFCLTLVFSLMSAAASHIAIAGPALLFEASTGKVLYAEDIDDQWHPASLTKIMTAYLVFQDIKAGKLTLKSKIKCTKAAHAQPASKIGMAVGTEMLVDTALKALIIKSANDVAVMIAEHVGGTHNAFIARMNATAKKLGMTKTHFVNPNGLPAKAQVTTARDLARLARAVVKEFPEFAHYWKMPRFRLGKIRLASHNRLLRSFAGADGLKTGFICDSGFNVVASATRDGRQLMAVVLGEPSGKERTIRAASLLEYGFEQYFWKTLFSSTSIDNLPVDAKAKPVRSVRDIVLNWSCGGKAAKASRRAYLAKQRAKARARKLAKKKKNKKSKQN